MSNNVTRIKSVGGTLDLDIVVALTDKQINDMSFNFNSISTVKDLQPYLTPPPQQQQQQSNNNTQLSNNTNNTCSLYPYVSLTSSNFLINSLLYINKVSKTKCFIEYIIPFTCAYNDEAQFLREFVENITAKNLLLIEEHNLLNITPHITFTLKRVNADDDTVIESKHFVICDTNEYDKENNTYVGDLYSGLNYGSECSYLYTSVNELYKCKLDTYDEIHSFLTHVNDAFPHTKICINYTNCYVNDNDSEIDIDIINSISDLLALTDIYVFEHKEVSDYFSLIKTLNEHESNAVRTYMSSSNSNSRGPRGNERVAKINVEDVFIKEIHNNTTKKAKRVKIGIFINEMKTISIIQQDPLSKLIMFHSSYDINYLPLYINDNDKTEYNNLLSTHYDIIKSVFIGGFLSRLFNNKSFQTCYTAANESVKRIIDILRFNLTFPIEPSYYIITVKKPKQQQQQQQQQRCSKQSTANYQKESHFILDCTNVLSSRKKEYNSLYDRMCSSYFSNVNTRKHLHKLGFINKRGVILHDPDKKYFGRSIRNKLLMGNYEKEKSELEKRKESNEIMKLQLKNIAKSKQDGVKYKNVNELMEMSAVFNFEKTAYRKLPSITGKTKGKGKECGSKYNTDLYFKEIKHSRFLAKNNSSHSFCKLANVKARYLNRNASCDDRRKNSNNKRNHKEYVYYEKESVDSNNNKGSDIEVEEYVNKDKFLNLLNTYEEKLKKATTTNE